MEAVGAGALENTFKASKSVWGDSVEVGPRSAVLGGAEAESEVRVVERVRVWVRSLAVFRGCGERRLGREECGEKRFGKCGGYWRRGKVSMALRARRRGTLGPVIVVIRWG